MCHHTEEPTVLSRVSCRPAPEYWPFSPALPVTLTHPLLPPKHGWLGQGQVRTVVPVPRGGLFHDHPSRHWVRDNQTFPELIVFVFPVCFVTERNVGLLASVLHYILVFDDSLTSIDDKLIAEVVLHVSESSMTSTGIFVSCTSDDLRELVLESSRADVKNLRRVAVRHLFVRNELKTCERGSCSKIIKYEFLYGARSYCHGERGRSSDSVRWRNF